MKKVDCHVHSKYSKNTEDKINKLGSIIGIKDSYNGLDPIYKIAKKRGMDYVAITDHETIEGALILNEKHSDIIIGEEIEVKASDEGHLVHLVTLGINEKNHEDFQDLKYIGLKETTDYLKANKIAHYLAHISLSVSGQDLSRKLINEWMISVDTLEVINGVSTPEENKFAKRISKLYHKNQAGGSDSHTLRGIGTAYTISEKASNKEEFLKELFNGNVYAEGNHCNFLRLVYDAHEIMYKCFFQTMFKPNGKKNRPRYKKYFLDYLALLGFFPLSLTVLPTAALTYLHQINQKNKVIDLNKKMDYIIKS